MAKFYGIGVGPGDPELLTVKATQRIKKLDVLYTPLAHHGGISVAEKIAQPYLPTTLEIKQRHFPMVKDLATKEKSWAAIAAEIVSDVQAGHDVGFLTLGDPSVYSTYSYILERVQDQIEVETIAGISSFSQIAASLSLPLMLDDELLTVVPATTDEATLKSALDLNDNLVIMKVATHWQMVYRLLADANLLEHAIVVANASMAQQAITPVSQLTAASKLPYFATMLVKKHQTLG
ncbi:cobalt-factor II C(20)-methyltransferase [Loigolactobacillus jiayinensis]|uniref:Cobalt-factor II C(20)-methyltransferase n=1 Tax=Loigolactobacillus jiayinensis TaxID=2486016 RepID=A0ABW1RDY4_9LACO|nr:cobalt-factor II C(20)-methyltransferase [Loigolactobacillus jiayinensis]